MDRPRFPNLKTYCWQNNPAISYKTRTRSAAQPAPKMSKIAFHSPSVPAEWVLRIPYVVRQSTLLYTF